MEENNDKSETLDMLYSEYLTALRDVVLQIECEDDINLCKHWLQIFNDSSKEHKVARNCLISLLYQQLKTNERLGEPFTDISNISRDLCSILCDLGIECNISSKCTDMDSTNFTYLHDENHSKEDQSLRSSSKHSIVPKDSFHIQQIDDINKFFLEIKRNNEVLNNEVRKLRQENQNFQLQNEEKVAYVRKLFDIFKDFKNYYKNLEQNENEDITIESKESIVQIYPTTNEGTNATAQDYVCLDGLQEVTINEEELFNALNNLITVLKTSLHEENPLESFFKLNTASFSQIFKNCSCIAFKTKLALYESDIQSLTKQIMQKVKSYYITQLNKNEFNDDVESISKAVSSKPSKIRNITHESSSDYSRHNEQFKIKYLGKCLLKMQKSRSKLIEKYENKLEEQTRRNRIQQKIQRLKLASISTKIFLRGNLKNQEELLDFTNYLEAKYKDIIAEGMNRMRNDL